MEKEKYLIFAPTLNTLDVDDVDTSSAVEVQLTTALVNPLAALTATGGGVEFEVQIKANAAHTFGTAYGTPTAGDYVTINPAGYTFATGTGKVTVITAATDGVDGVTTDTSTAGNNDFRINMLKHVSFDGTGVPQMACFPASNFRGMQTVNATTTDLYFEAMSGDIDAVDVVLVTHGSGKYQELAEMVRDAISPSKTGVPVEFFVGGSTGATGTKIANIAYNGNPAAITELETTIDT